MAGRRPVSAVVHDKEGGNNGDFTEMVGEGDYLGRSGVMTDEFGKWLL